MVLCSSVLLVLAFYGVGFAGPLEQGGPILTLPM